VAFSHLFDTRCSPWHLRTRSLLYQGPAVRPLFAWRSSCENVHGIPTSEGSPAPSHNSPTRLFPPCYVQEPSRPRGPPLSLQAVRWSPWEVMVNLLRGCGAHRSLPRGCPFYTGLFLRSRSGDIVFCMLFAKTLGGCWARPPIGWPENSFGVKPSEPDVFFFVDSGVSSFLAGSDRVAFRPPPEDLANRSSSLGPDDFQGRPATRLCPTPFELRTLPLVSRVAVFLPRRQRTLPSTCRFHRVRPASRRVRVSVRRHLETLMVLTRRLRPFCGKFLPVSLRCLRLLGERIPRRGRELCFPYFPFFAESHALTFWEVTPRTVRPTARLLRFPRFFAVFLSFLSFIRRSSKTARISSF